MMNDESRLLSKVMADENGCWIWTACRSQNGYGKTWLRGKYEYAHRAMYTVMVGPIPDDQVLDHLCRVRACVNPGHLEPVSHRENLARGENFIAGVMSRVTCVNGHNYTPENTKYEGATRSRRCLTCRRAYDKRRRGSVVHKVAELYDQALFEAEGR